MQYTTLLTKASAEKDVESAYKQAFSEHWPSAQISSPHNTDGLVEHDNIRLLCETKYDKDLKSRPEVMSIVSQLIFYLKKFEQVGEPLPNIMFVGDADECFVVATNKVVDYLKLDIDWEVAPSSQHLELEAILVQDTEIAPFIFDVGLSTDFTDVVNKIEGIAAGKSPQIRATTRNIESLYNLWEERIFKGNIDPKTKVTAFLKAMFYPEDVYIHPKQKNILVVNRGAGIKVKIDVDAYRGFFNNFHQGYSPSEIDSLLLVQDTLLEETTRRFQGEFYTPPYAIREAHRRIAEECGENWKEHLVIDVAAGIANLTRGYKFDNLVLSTLHQDDVDVIGEQGYNRGAVVEQWDFLREEMPATIKAKLEEARDKPVIFFSNPPYGAPGHLNKTATGISTTSVGDRMKDRDVGGSAASQLYTQFMFEVNELTEEYNLKSTLVYYTKPNFMTGSGYDKFGDWWQKNWDFKQGMLMPASDFAGVTQKWSVSLTIWRKR